MPDSDLTVQQFARLTNFHPETVRRLIRTGKLQAYRLNAGRYRIPRHVLADLRDRQEGRADA
jgi:excisionase family DNA binding protein